MSNSAKLDKLVQNVGYQYVRSVRSQDGLKHAILEFKKGPGFILVIIDLGGRRDFLRPLKLAEIKDRFMLFFNQL